MEKGKLVDHYIRCGNFMDLDNLVKITKEIEVGKHDPFRQPGCPAREWKNGDRFLGVYPDGTVQAIRSLKE
jgi:hypothetical protein